MSDRDTSETTLSVSVQFQANRVLTLSFRKAFFDRRTTARDILSLVPSPAPLGAHVRFDCAGEADEDL